MTTPTDFRALCAELADELDEWIEGYLINDPADEHTAAAQAMVDRARTLLAAPVPVGERLPVPADFDTEGRLWWFNRAGMPEWQLVDGGPYGNYWLPLWALPLPEAHG